MIKSPSEFKITLEEVESVFNAYVENELTEFEKEKERFVKDPLNKAGKITGVYMPKPNIRVWIKIPKATMSSATENAFRIKVESAGWQVIDWTWQEDERTGAEQLYINVRAMDRQS